ncbi:MAG: hypothetical protein N2556_04015 [Anaerolineae bacterium]|nr:hypothetical protein [Anaerolineae bacterium]
MDVPVVDPEVLAQAIRSSGRPLHINVLTRAAARAWLETRAGPRPYAPGNSYRVGETVCIADQTATVEATHRGENPKQGPFAILILRFPDGTKCLKAAEIPGAPVAEKRPSVPEERIDALIEAREAEIRQATRTTLQADPRFVSLQTPQGEIWCLQEMLPPVDAPALRKVLVGIQRIPRGEGEPLSYSTEELVHIAWGLTNDGSATYDLHAFALCRTLTGQEEVANLGDRWTSSVAWTTFTTRTALTPPRVPTRLTPPVQAEVVRRQETGRSGRRWKKIEEKEPEAEEWEQDLETWRRSRPIQAVFTLRARHYYEGWLPLDRQVRRLFAPLASGRQEVVFYHHFGDQPESFRAWVDRGKGRIWVSPEMYETFRRHRIYPGARLRISARSEQEYDIATRPTDRTDPIRVWRMWLDEKGCIQYEEYQEPRLYDVEDEVYVADVRFEDLQALFRQAEEVGNSVFGLMYEKACQWWEAGGRQPLMVTADQLFQAIHFDEKGRMVSKATIAWELWQRRAFEPLGGGQYRFRPEFDTQKEPPTPVRSSRSRPRRPGHPPPGVPPVSEQLQEIAEILPETVRVVEWPREPEATGPATMAIPVTELAEEEARVEAEPALLTEPKGVAVPVAEPGEEAREAPPEAAIAPVAVLLSEAEETRPEAELVSPVEQEVEAAPLAESVIEAEETPSEAEIVSIGVPLAEPGEARPEIGAIPGALPLQPEAAIPPAGEPLSETVEAPPAAPPSEAPAWEAEPIQPALPAAPVWEEAPPLDSAVGGAPPCPEMAAPTAGRAARRHRIRRVYAAFRSLLRELAYRLLRTKSRAPRPPEESPDPPEER